MSSKNSAYDFSSIPSIASNRPLSPVKKQITSKYPEGRCIDDADSETWVFVRCGEWDWESVVSGFGCALKGTNSGFGAPKPWSGSHLQANGGAVWAPMAFSETSGHFQIAISQARERVARPDRFGMAVFGRVEHEPGSFRGQFGHKMVPYTIKTICCVLSSRSSSPPLPQIPSATWSPLSPPATESSAAPSSRT